MATNILGNADDSPMEQPEKKSEAVMTKRDFLKVAGGVVLGLGAGEGARQLLRTKEDPNTVRVRAFWEQQRALWSRIERAGGFQEYIDSLPREEQDDLALCTHPPQESCDCCVDEAIRAVRGSGNRKTRMIREVGSGILPLGLEGVDLRTHNPYNADYIRHVASRQNEMQDRLGQVMHISYHDECGGGAMAYQAAHGLTRDEMHHLEPGVVDAWVANWTNRVFNERRDQLTRNGKHREAGQLRNIHVDFATNMDRPAGLHMPDAIYYGAEFDYSSPLLPQGFGINRRFLTKEQAQANLAAAKGIDFGSHGPGQLFTAQHPLRIVTLGSRSLNQADMENEVREAFQNDADFQQSRVVVNGATLRTAQ